MNAQQNVDFFSLSIGTLFIVAIALIVIILALIKTFTIVSTNEAAIVERLGKYNKTLDAGFHVLIPFIDRIVQRVNLRVRSDTIKVSAKTEDNVFVNMQIALQYKIDEHKIEDSYYKSNDFMNLATSFIQDSIRSAVPSLSLDDVFAKKDDISKQVFEVVRDGMADYGVIFLKTLITNVTPDDDVIASMNSINIAQREKVAAQDLAEADRIKLVAAASAKAEAMRLEASAKAEAMRLEGEGISSQRTKIIDGLSSNMSELKTKGINNTEVLNLLLLTQYMNTIESIGKSGNSKILFLPGGADSIDNLSKQIMSSIMASNNYKQ